MSETTHTLIIGTGFAGLGLATRLKREGNDDFLLIDRASDVGGTWRDNDYPGAACDVPSHLYSFSFRLKPDWSRVFAPGREIWGYLQETARDEGLLSHIRFDAALVSADWDEASNTWHVQTTNGDFLASVLVTAMGHLADGKLPNIPGLESFGGHLMHSSQWNHEVDLAGKRVAVIGSGASAIQITPTVAEMAEDVVVFQRSAPYVIARPDREYTDTEKRAFARSPELMEQLRGDLFWMMEYNYAQRRGVSRFVDEAMAVALAHRNAQVTDPELNAMLTPDYVIGCKRILFSNTYYPALQKPNVTLEPTALDRVEGTTLVSAAGNSFDVDVVVCATGFEAVEPPFAPLISAHGQSLADHWTQGMRANSSVTVAGFPNLFIMNGPNTGLGHNSVIFVVESQVEYIVQALGFMRTTNISILETRAEAEEAYVSEIRDRSAGTVWLAGGCTNWYVDPRTNQLTVTWPDFAYAFRESNGSFDVSAFVAT